MKVACIDLEGVLVPELWPLIARISGVDALSITTREEPNYYSLMEWRIRHLREHRLRLQDVKEIVSEIAPYPESFEFLRCLRLQYQLQIVSDCFYELADPVLQKLGSPRAYCHSLQTDENGWITRCKWAARRGKEDHVAGLLKQNFEILAAGDAFNDLAMLRLAHRGFLVRPSGATRAVAGDIPIVENLSEILACIATAVGDAGALAQP